MGLDLEEMKNLLKKMEEIFESFNAKMHKKVKELGLYPFNRGGETKDD